MPLRRISSLLTFPYKFVLPAFFVVGFLNMLIWGKWYPGDQPGFPPMAVYLISLPFLLLILWNYCPAKRVFLDQQNQRLYVSNYRKEIAIPFSEIASVNEFILSDPTRITIGLREPSEFGQKIVFLGTYRFGGWLAGSHPIVKELSALAAKSNESPF